MVDFDVSASPSGREIIDFYVSAVPSGRGMDDFDVSASPSGREMVIFLRNPLRGWGVQLQKKTATGPSQAPWPIFFVELEPPTPARDSLRK